MRHYVMHFFMERNGTRKVLKLCSTTSVISNIVEKTYCFVILKGMLTKHKNLGVIAVIFVANNVCVANVLRI